MREPLPAQGAPDAVQVAVIAHGRGALELSPVELTALQRVAGGAAAARESVVLVDFASGPAAGARVFALALAPVA